MATTTSLPIICSLSEFFDQDEYDYLIVGGGTAGLVLASRLSEDPKVRVGVLEAGDARLGDPNIASPVGMANLLNNPDYDWCFQSTPQAGNNDKVHHVPRGKCLGGSSCINFLAYCRPSRADIDNWERLGHKGWNWSSLEPYYLKSQRVAQGNIPMHGPQDSFARDPRFHGDGPIGTSFPSWRYPFEDRLLHALDEEAGTIRPIDAYSGNHLGFYGTLSTIDRTERPIRSDAATGYLSLIADRPNLKILPNAVACRIILSDSSEPLTARGVVFSCEGQMHHVHAKRETILACSTIKTPQLLELSGIGDAAVLEAAGVTCRVALPAVGNNLQEHPMTSVTYELSSENETIDSLFSDPSRFADALQQYMESGDGPVSGSISLTGFLPYPSLVSESRLEQSIERITTTTEKDTLTAELLRSPKAASVHFACAPANFCPKSGHGNLSRVMPGAPAGHGPCYTILVSDAYPLSRGSSHITTSDPFAAPRIDLGLLSHPFDVDVLAAGAIFADNCFRSPHVADQVVQRISPPASLNMNDWEQVRQHASDQLLIFNHILGTCAMGDVVDERLRVKGVRGLRIVDASVIPLQMSGNTIATVYAVAERAADLIKEERSD